MYSVNTHRTRKARNTANEHSRSRTRTYKWHSRTSTSSRCDVYKVHSETRWSLRGSTLLQYHDCDYARIRRHPTWAVLYLLYTSGSDASSRELKGETGEREKESGDNARGARGDTSTRRRLSRDWRAVRNVGRVGIRRCTPLLLDHQHLSRGGKRVATSAEETRMRSGPVLEYTPRHSSPSHRPTRVYPLRNAILWCTENCTSSLQFHHLDSTFLLNGQVKSKK